ncbi:DUF4013 domain-containing protein, partial [Methanosphaera sp.]
MDLFTMMSKSLRIPFNNYNIWIILGMICLLSIVYNLNTTNLSLAVILVLVGILFEILKYGVSLDVMRSAMNKSDDIPQFDLRRNFIEGIKSLIVTIIYYIIPVLVSVLIACILGSGDVISQLIWTYELDFSQIPASVLTGSGIDILIPIIVFVILLIFSILFEVTSQGILVQTGSIRDAINVREVYSRIKTIGWSNYIGCIIFLGIVSGCISSIGTFISVIPSIGILLEAFIIESYLLI